MIRSASLGLLLLAVVGCATASADKVIPITDVKSLSGKWLGFATGPAAGVPTSTELIINPDGTWTSRSGAQQQGGTVTVTDGKLQFSRGTASGPSTTLPQASTAVLQERAGKRVLVGQGRSDLGPYSYEFVEQK